MQVEGCVAVEKGVCDGGMTEEGRSVLVTVGTTSFDELVGSIAEENFMKVSTVYARNDP